MAAEPLSQRRAGDSPPRAILAPASPATSCSTTSPRTSSSSCPSTAAAAARSHHPPSFLVSLHHTREGTASLLPSSSEFSTRPPLRHHSFGIPLSLSAVLLLLHLLEGRICLSTFLPLFHTPSFSFLTSDLSAVSHGGDVYTEASQEPCSMNESASFRLLELNLLHHTRHQTTASFSKERGRTAQ